MRTKKISVLEQQRNWMLQHRHADALVCDKDGIPVRAMYKSPLEQWKGMIAPDGTVNVPDMEYYNSLQDEGEILKVVEELAQGERD